MCNLSCFVLDTFVHLNVVMFVHGLYTIYNLEFQNCSLSYDSIIVYHTK